MAAARFRGRAVAAAAQVGMTARPDSPVVLCRPAFARDRRPLLSFLKEIWEGEDYVPAVWDRWLKEEPGLLAVAELGGEVVGQGHLLDMGGGEWWLEGLRVHPDYQGQGLGSHLHNYFVDRWLATDGEVVRLATHTDREAVHAMCERTDFERRGEFIHTAGSAAPGQSFPDLRTLEDMPSGAGLERLSKAPQTTALGGLVDYGWRFAEPSPERVNRLADAIEWLDWREGAGLVLLTIERRGEHNGQISALDAEGDDLVRLLLELRGWAAEQGLDELIWLPPTEGESLEAAAAAGFTVHDEDTLYLYERKR